MAALGLSMVFKLAARGIPKKGSGVAVSDARHCYFRVRGVRATRMRDV